MPAVRSPPICSILPPTVTFVVVAAKLSPETRGRISALVLRAMQPTAYFVNIARAAIVDYRSGRCYRPRLRWSDRRRIGVAPVCPCGPEEDAMKLRLALALVIAVIGAVLIPSPAAASPPTEEEFSPVGDQFLCGETLVTVRSGTVLEREHVHELGSGLSQVIVIETPNDVILTDEEGNAYRLVGTARGNFVTAADPENEFALESGFFAFKANLIGESGLFGTIDFLLRRDQNGNELIRDRGSCHFA
jgi:hypothetical protein